MLQLNLEASDVGKKSLCFLQENNAMSLELNYRSKLHEVVREVKKRLVRISVVCGNIVLLLLCNCLYFCVLALATPFASFLYLFHLLSTWPVMPFT